MSTFFSTLRDEQTRIDESPTGHAPRQTADDTAAPAAGPLPPRWLRRWITAGLVLHLLAVVTAPCAVAPASRFWQRLWTGFQPYLEAAFLNHGYHFFSPEPGPSHLIRYEATHPSGEISRGYFPDKTRHRSRLLYHRHFMLSEHFNSLAESGADPALLDTQLQSFARHILHTEHATHVTLYLVRHELPSSHDVLAGAKLDDPKFYQERPLGTFTSVPAVTPKRQDTQPQHDLLTQHDLTQHDLTQHDALPVRK